jgi:hypothetical protein
VTGQAWADLLRQRYPRCPGFFRDEILQRLAERPCPPERKLAARMLDDMAAAVVRHQLTDYDRLRTAHGLTRAEAADITAADITEQLADWRGG